MTHRETERPPGKSLLVMLSEAMCTRVFVESGILELLMKRSDMPLVALVAHENFKLSEYEKRFGRIKFMTMDQVLGREPLDTWRKLLAGLDGWLDSKFGFYPLALRLSMKHGFNEDRQAIGHKNNFHNPALAGPLPRWEVIFRLMRGWYYSGARFFHPAIRRFYEDENVGALLVNNSQTPGAHAFAYTAKKMGIGAINYVASWDHPVGKGVFPPYFDRYIVQNKTMENALAEYHGIPKERITITGWPQMDKYSPAGHAGDYAALLAKWGIDPAKPCVLLAGNTEVNTPFEPYLFERLLNWRDGNGGADLWSAVVRPHPKDLRWRERFASIVGKDGVYFQPDTLSDMDELAALLRGVSCVVCTGGTILLDSLVNDRPAVGVTYDENAPPGSAFAISNYTMHHYRDVVESGAFYRADCFEKVTDGIKRAISAPGELAGQRAALRRLVADELDGKAAERIVEAILMAAARAEAADA